LDLVEDFTFRLLASQEENRVFFSLHIVLLLFYGKKMVLQK